MWLGMPMPMPVVADCRGDRQGYEVVADKR